MSRVTSNWIRLRTRFQQTTGFSPKMTIGEIANKEVITGSPGNDVSPVWGGQTNGTTFDVQALESDFPTDPVKGTAVALTDTAQGAFTRQFLSAIRRDGIAYFTLGDISG